MKKVNIMDYITDKPISRKELVSATGLCDRLVRREIEEARKNGNVIINLQDGRGYFTTNDMDIIKAQYKLNQHRAMEILKQQKYLRLVLKTNREKAV